MDLDSGAAHGSQVRPVTGRARDGREIEALFVALRAGGSEAVRTTLIERHLPLARRLASRYRYTPQPLEDLIQVASLALVKAVDAFDPERGVAFSTFAVPTIVGELKRHMRETAWVVRVPRALQERTLAVERAERTLSARLGAAPTAAELASETGFSTEEVLEALSARVAHDAVRSTRRPAARATLRAAIGARLATSDSGSTTRSGACSSRARCGSSPTASARSCGCGSSTASRRPRSPNASASRRCTCRACCGRRSTSLRTRLS